MSTYNKAKVQGGESVVGVVFVAMGGGEMVVENAVGAGEDVVTMVKGTPSVLDETLLLKAENTLLLRLTKDCTPVRSLPIGRRKSQQLMKS